eukprot:1145222-Pelagomonas_calceolata.AAC.2
MEVVQATQQLKKSAPVPEGSIKVQAPIQKEETSVVALQHLMQVCPLLLHLVRAADPLTALPPFLRAAYILSVSMLCVFLQVGTASGTEEPCTKAATPATLALLAKQTGAAAAAHVSSPQPTYDAA